MEPFIEVKELKVGGKSHYEINVFFSKTHWEQLPPFITFLHTESLQILQIPRSMLVLLLFSSDHSFSIGFRSGTGMAIADASFCDQWPIFVLILMFVFGSLSCWKIQTWPVIRFLAQAVWF